jgi:thymidylate synthase
MTTSTGTPPVWLQAPTLGDVWLAIAREILASGRAGQWDGLPLREVFRVTLQVDVPAVDDAIIAQHADPERLAWMHANFTDHARVAELEHADSYATRLYDYARSGLDQIATVIGRLRADPFARNATITTFQPLTDTSYIPCVSLLDFWLEDGQLQLAAYCHGIDFGTKGYANLIELADIQQRVAGELGVGAGALTMTVKSAHIYDTELDSMRQIVDDANAADRHSGRQNLQEARSEVS